MEQQTRFKIVFEKLSEAQRGGAIAEAELLEVVRLGAESDEIAELRRAVSDITEPEPKSFTTT